MRHIIPISGKDSLCAAIVQQARQPDLPYEYLFCDVRMELPETYQWLDDVEGRLGIRIHRLGKSLESVIAECGILPGHTYRFCTKLAKIDPIKEYLGKNKALQYLGFRADEAERLPPAGTSHPNITERYPLIEAGINLPMVFKILGDRGVLPPSFFWQSLYDTVLKRCTNTSRRFVEDAPPWTRNYLFSWRTRSNCFCCFYQRLYEWVGLLEHHPDLFARAEELERVYGSRTSETRLSLHDLPVATGDYYFNQGWPLKAIRASSAEIFAKHVEKTWKTIVEARHRSVEGMDLMSLTSCGALCGK